MNTTIAALSRWLASFTPRQSALLVALFGGLLYVNTIPNRYAVDDALVITTHPQVQQGLRGIGGILTGKSWLAGNAGVGYYRPLSLITFAVEQQFFHGNPHVSHAINALLYGCTGALVLLLLYQCWPGYAGAPLLTAALLFMAHPLHTEVVANLKSRDELLAFLLLCGSLLLWLRAGPHRLGQQVLAAGLFYLALLAKESALVGVLLWPGLLYYTRSRTPPAWIKALALPTAVVVLYVMQRQAIGTGALLAAGTDKVSFPYATRGVAWPAMWAQLWLYFRLLVWPCPLSYNYAFEQLPVNGWAQADVWAGIGVALLAVIGWWRGCKSRSYGSLALFMTGVWLLPALGFVLLKGGIPAERLVYGAVLGPVVGAMCWASTSRLSNRLKWLVPVGLLLVYSVLTLQRNTYWKDDLTLSAHDVQVSPRSCQVHLHYGKCLIDAAVAEANPATRQQRFDQGMAQLRQAVAIYPLYARAYFKMAYAFQMITHQRDSAVYYYQRAIAAAPGYTIAYKNMALLYAEDGQWEQAREWMRQAIRLDSALQGGEELLRHMRQLAAPASPRATTTATDSIAYARYTNTGVQLARDNKFDEALPYLQKACELAPASVQAMLNLAACYGSMQQYAQSEAILLKAEQAEPANLLVLRNLYILYTRMGNSAKAAEYQRKYESR